MQTSIANIAKNRIIEEMFSSVCFSSPTDSNDLERGVGKKPNHFVLVLDSHTLKIVSSVCKRYDLSEKGAIFIEQIDKPRQPFADLDALYFLSPSETSIAQLLNDHKSSESLLYRYSHVFFTSKVIEKLFQRLIENKIFSARCKNFVEMNLDFIVYEHCVFHCDTTESIFHLGLEKAGNLDEEKIVQKHVVSLLSLCASLGDKPVIRYMSSSAISKRVAASLRTEIDALAKSSGGEKNLKSRGTSLLILDRSIETSPLFLHDFFYESLALDILDGIETDNSGVQWALSATTDTATSVVPSFEYKTVTGKGEEKRKVLLCEFSDPFWSKYKYEHFRVVSDMIRGELGELTAKINTNSSVTTVAPPAAAAPAGEDPLVTLRKLPEYQDKISKLGVHIELSKKLMEVFDKLKLMEAAKIEQELATGLDDDGKEINCGKIFASFHNILSRLGPEERLRIILLYLSQVHDISPSTTDELIRSLGGLDLDFEKIVKKFLDLKIHNTRVAPSLTTNTTTTSSSSPEGPDAPFSKRGSLTTPSVQATRHVSKIEKSTIKRNRQILKNSKFIHCRFASELSNIVEHCLGNKLETSLYPNIGGTGTSKYTSLDEVGVGASGGGAAAWAAAALEEEKSTLGGDKRQKLIVFVIGGITLTEIREANELSNKYGIDVIAGGSCILTSKRFIEILSKH